MGLSWVYFEHRETRRTGTNSGERVVTFCGNSEPRNLKLLIEKMERAKGFEPSARKSQQPSPQGNIEPVKPGYTQIRTQIRGAACPDLAQVVAAWANLPSPLKAAILAIVNSSTALQEDPR